MNDQTDMFPETRSAKSASPLRVGRWPITRNGYKIMEVISALQKAIRRCDEPLAMWWAREILSVGWHKYLWSRLAIIAVEDTAEPNALTWVEIGRRCFYGEAKYRTVLGSSTTIALTR